jgi:hypothetical protein
MSLAEFAFEIGFLASHDAKADNEGEGHERHQ